MSKVDVGRFDELSEEVSYGAIKLMRIGNFLFTQTQKEYALNTGGFEPVPAANGSYLLLPWDEKFHADSALLARRVKDRLQGICVLAGDESRVYWNYRLLDDGTVVVMDERGSYYHVTVHPESGLAVKTLLGRAVTPAEEEYIDCKIKELNAVIRAERQHELLKKIDKKEAQRKRLLKSLQGAVPFKMGSKWGLRTEERIVVPPVYRQVESPVGCFCAFEKYPGCWGVMELDGRVVVEPKYQKVVFSGKNRVKLVQVNGETKFLSL